MPSLISVNVGLPRDLTWRGKAVYTAIWKSPAAGRCMVRRLNIDGDGQGDLAGHGGEHRAVMVYQIDSYGYWQRYLGRNDFVYGQFGENFTVEGLPDAEVCVGDRYRIGTALFEVTQPRVTCYRVGIRMDKPDMPSLLVANHRPGFYLRVLEEGEVGAGDEIFKVIDGPEHVTIAELDAMLYLPGHSPGALARALRIPALSSGWKISLNALLTQDSPESGNAGLAASVPPPVWQGFRPLRVVQTNRESASVVSLVFGALDGSPLPAGLPGQFLVLKLQTKPDVQPILRNYSMSGRPGADVYRISVKQELGGVASTFLHKEVAVGDVIQVSAPRGAFLLRPGNGPVVLISAGIGATPVLAMLHSLAGEHSSREVWWLYGARSSSDHPFARESHELLNTLTSSRKYVAYSRPEAGDRLGEHYDAEGHLSGPIITQFGLPLDAHFYLCGPRSFMRDLSLALKEMGVADGQVHSETFGPEDSVTPGILKGPQSSVHSPVGVAGTGPRVSFTRSGLAVAWNSRFQSLLELAEACDVPAKWSCRTGVCHTCECALIGGTVTYEPDPLDLPVKGNILICCSRPENEVEIDL